MPIRTGKNWKIVSGAPGYAELVFIGTGSATPIGERWLPGLLVKIRGDFLLLDCGEGVQYRILKAGLKVNRLVAILITHLHGDHLYGLPGLLESLGMWGRTSPLKVLGPTGIEDFIEHAVFSEDLGYELVVETLKPGVVMYGNGYDVITIPVRHTINSFAFIILEHDLPGKFSEEKAKELGIPAGPIRRQLLAGKKVKLHSGRVVEPSEVVGPPRRGLKIVYSGDTMPCVELIEASSKADVIIHEATFSSHNGIEAYLSGHSTALEAAHAASVAKAKVLILKHFSNRYKNLDLLLQEARQVFEGTYLSRDLLKLIIRRQDEESLITTFLDLSNY
ncbi:MAG: ribonuclease Z [Thermofilaceae archaeon]